MERRKAMFLASDRSSPTVKTDCGSSADLRVMFAFFSNRLGCIGSLIVSVVGSLVLILVLRGCGAF
jgi:hypothetical protein